MDDDDVIIYFKSPDPDDDRNHAEPPNSSLLQLQNLCTKADCDLNPGHVAKQLKDSFDSNALSYAPQYAVIDIPTDDVTSATPDNDLQHDVANPLVVDEYSVYGERVNC